VSQSRSFRQPRHARQTVASGGTSRRRPYRLG
jgi:hypothetical protein